jgi:hypothetical protein
VGRRALRSQETALTILARTLTLSQARQGSRTWTVCVVVERHVVMVIVIVIVNYIWIQHRHGNVRFYF